MNSDESATILVVDDEEAVLEAVAMYLESAGYDVRTAANGGEAIVELDPVVDVVLLDRRMPGMTGDEVLEHIREWHANCRVAMVSAVDPGPDILDMPLDDYLTKPVKKQQLLDMVEQLLLFDRYEELIDEYHSLVKKYAVLESHRRRLGIDQEVLSDLEARRESILDDIDDVFAQFADDTVTEVFRRMQPSSD